MKRVWRWAVSMLLVAAMVLSLPAGALPARAAGSLPTEVTECGTTGMWTEFLCVAFEKKDDQNWLNAITTVTVNGSEYTHKETIGYFDSVSKAWTVGSYTGAYSSYPALKITTDGMSYPVTIVASATGYPDAMITVTKQDYSSYVATITENKTEPTTYKVSVDDSIEHGSAAVDKESAEEGDTVTITLEPNDGYEIDTVTVTDSDDQSVDVSDNYTFTMPASDVKISATFKQTASPEPTKYAITVSEAIENGTVTVDKNEAAENDTVTITVTPADKYDLDALTVTDANGDDVSVNDDYEFTMPASNVTVSATFKQKDAGTDPDPDPTKTITVEQITVSGDLFGQTWYFNVSDDDEYVGKITSIKVNDTTWDAYDYSVATGGRYRTDADNNRIEFAQKEFGSNPTTSILKSGDVITITADGYNDLTLKFIVDSKTGEAYVTEDDGEGDPYVLYVKLEGSFDSAITGQEYDAVSGASTGVSLSKNSSVTVYGALVAKGTEPTDSDWHELEAWQSSESGIDLDSSKCHAYVIPDTDKGTTEDKDSGLTGVYLVISSDLTLSGTAKDPGDYLVYVEIADEQGRTATSNKIPVRVYSGEETLADKMITNNMTQTADGKYMWDQEPWAIKNFGSNVDGESESVRVLSGLKAWYGSHTSGTYGYLGYDLAWDKVMAGEIPQTLYIPSGCDLTLVNMKILSSVRIVIEDGGKLTLRDSVVQGIIDVEKGGTFSMNYDSYSGKFLTGSSVCGQIRLQDGAILENAAIYSHANYLANGDLTDRTAAHPVVTATGDVTIKGDVYIEGDAGGSVDGQTGLLVKDGTVNVSKDSTLVVIGGESMLGWDGGTAIKLDHGKITGEGKLVAIGGESGPIQGDGGDAVSGNGTISTDQTFLRGATAYEGIAPGKAIASGSNIKIDSPSKSVEDGVYKDLYSDPYEALYWKTGINPQPPLDQYTLDPVTRYTVTVIKAEHGKVTASETRARANDKITLTTTPDDGYELQSLLVVDTNNNELLSWQKDAKAVRTDSFLMPAADVTVTATFAKTAQTEDPDKGKTDPDDKGNTDTDNKGIDTDNKGSDNKNSNAGNSSSNESSSSHSHKHSGSSSSAAASVNVNVNNNASNGANAAADAQTGNITESGVTGNAANVGTAVDNTAIGTEDGAGDGHIGATGDDSHMTLWLTIMMISAAALAVTTGYIRKNTSGR